MSAVSSYNNAIGICESASLSKYMNPGVSVFVESAMYATEENKLECLNRCTLVLRLCKEITDTFYLVLLRFFCVVKLLNSCGYSPHLRLEKAQNYFANSAPFISLQSLKERSLEISMPQLFLSAQNNNWLVKHSQNTICCA